MERDFFLERYFSKEHPRTDNAFCYGSTACCRGYIATWILENDKLFLKTLQTEPWPPDDLGKNIPITKIFPTATNQVFASWVTAQVRIPLGRELPFRHDGSGSDHELDLYVNITNGVIESQHEVENIGKLAMISFEHTQWVCSAEEPVEDGYMSLKRD